MGFELNTWGRIVRGPPDDVGSWLHVARTDNDHQPRFGHADYVVKIRTESEAPRITFWMSEDETSRWFGTPEGAGGMYLVEWGDEVGQGR